MEPNKNEVLDNYNFSIETNSLKGKNEAPKGVRENIPEGALYFKAVASNGELNRNGYIIRPNAWKANKGVYLKDYLENGRILYQHNSEKPIGKPLSLKVVGDQLILEGWIYDDTYTEGNVGRGLVTSISTGHITLESEYENRETGEVEDEETFFKDFWAGLEKLWSGVWIQAVTKAEIIENSLVTIGSNRKSHIISNNLLINKLGYLTEDQINLLSKKTGMNKKELEDMKNGITFPTNDVEETEEVVTEEEVVETDSEDTPEEVIETEEVVEEPIETEEVSEEKNNISKNEVKFVLTDEVKTFLTNTISESINKLENSFNLKLNALKEDKRNDLKQIVKSNKIEDTDPKSELRSALR